jgi:hypothetical protein
VADLTELLKRYADATIVAGVVNAGQPRFEAGAR